MQTFGGISFNVGNRYQVNKIIGSGSYGHVALAMDTSKKGKVAIKKLNKIEDEIDAKRVLREIKIQRSLNHKHILKMYNIVYDDTVLNHDFGDVYLISQFYPADLSKIIRSGQDLSVEHIQYIMYQLCKGLYFLHSAQVIHRDIKPCNILATENCEVCYCDFGFARKFDEQETQKEDFQMTEYVVTRYYRAPEVMLSSQQYSQAVDLWSLGCTFAELITGKILFKGQNYIQMIKLIFDTLGKPDQSDLDAFINNENAQTFVNTLPAKPKTHIQNIIKFQNEAALDLLNRMLEPNPQKRITAEQSLNHQFFSSIRNKDEETFFNSNIVCDFEQDEEISLNQLKELIIEEINLFRLQNNESTYNIPTEMKRIRLLTAQIEKERLANQQKAQKK